jgi:membrane protein YqaA with SNARE-associated domain
VIIIFLGCLLSAFIPRLWPVMIVFLGGLVLQGADPLLLSMVATGGAVTGTTGLWFFDSYVKQAVNRVMHHARSHWLVLAET